MSPQSDSPQHVAVVILNWNGRAHLETYLPSVLEYTLGEAEVWVADNGSTDDSLMWLESNHSEVRTVALERNWGFAEGYNKALAIVDADVYVLLNSDVRIVSRWIGPVLDVMDERGWSVASPLLVQDANPDFCEHAGAAGGWLDKDGFAFCLGRIFQELEPVDEWHRQNREVFWASGAALFVRKEAWVMSGGLDGALFAHMEEIDLCWRLQNMGHRIGCAGEVTVQHLGGGTLQNSSPFKTYLNFRNNLIVMLKNRRGPWPLFSFRRMVLDGMAACRMLTQGQWKQFLAVGKAHGAFYLSLPRVLRQRTLLRKQAIPEVQLAGWWKESVIWAHFVKGVKRARDLQLPPSQRS